MSTHELANLLLSKPDLPVALFSKRWALFIKKIDFDAELLVTDDQLIEPGKVAMIELTTRKHLEMSL